MEAHRTQGHERRLSLVRKPLTTLFACASILVAVVPTSAAAMESSLVLADAAVPAILDGNVLVASLESPGPIIVNGVLTITSSVELPAGGARLIIRSHSHIEIAETAIVIVPDGRDGAFAFARGPAEIARGDAGGQGGIIELIAPAVLVQGTLTAGNGGRGGTAVGTGGASAFGGRGGDAGYIRILDDAGARLLPGGVGGPGGAGIASADGCTPPALEAILAITCQPIGSLDCLEMQLQVAPEFDVERCGPAPPGDLGVPEGPGGLPGGGAPGGVGSPGLIGFGLSCAQTEVRGGEGGASLARGGKGGDAILDNGPCTGSVGSTGANGPSPTDCNGRAGGTGGDGLDAKATGGNGGPGGIAGGDGGDASAQAGRGGPGGKGGDGYGNSIISINPLCKGGQGGTGGLGGSATAVGGNGGKGNCAGGAGGRATATAGSGGSGGPGGMPLGPTGSSGNAGSAAQTPGSPGSTVIC